ncbi:C39 family peptidase [Shewanella corallii]|uniref:C39 family peptidase n=1 Tax=Shewanella corallii TaxID=560080 RepID=A0ABT0N2W8_9GAMM|nr:C39 family peptidase [Shewanella corallii]MCL2912445.1 C39 family peptidase [Shewanella corallii]
MPMTLNSRQFLSLTMLLLCWHPVQSAEVVLNGLVPNMGHYQKSIQSIRERKFEHLVPQQTDFSCGAASLATILKFAYGMPDIKEFDVMNGMLEQADMEVVAQKGFSLLDMKHFLKEKSLRGRGYRVGIEELMKLKIPAIVLINDNGYNHFVVLRRIDRGMVYLGDPALGNRIIPKKDFLGKWNQVVFVVIGRAYEKDTILLNPRERLSYRALEPVSPLSDAELMEFGFSYSDML